MAMTVGGSLHGNDSGGSLHGNDRVALYGMEERLLLGNDRMMLFVAMSGRVLRGGGMRPDWKGVW